MFQLRRFRAVDANVLCPDAVETNMPSESWYAAAAQHEKALTSYTLTCCGEPICAGGIDLDGCAWFLAGRSVVKHKKTVFKAVSIILDILVDELSLDSVTARVRTDLTVSYCFLKHLGFTYAGVEDDYYILRRLSCPSCRL